MLKSILVALLAAGAVTAILAAPAHTALTGATFELGRAGGHHSLEFARTVIGRVETCLIRKETCRSPSAAPHFTRGRKHHSIFERVDFNE